MAAMQVEIWSDVVCPWCYIGEHRFASALERFAHRDDVEVVLRSFQLDPSTPRDTHQRTVEMLSSKYGVSSAEALRMEQQLSKTAAAENLLIQPNRVVANTFDAHRLLHLAEARGKQAELARRLFAAHFSGELNVDDHDTLLRLASEAGLDAAEVQQVLDSDAYSAEVRADQQRASALGIRGVPFFVIDERYGVSGAQPADLLLNALNQAWTESHPITLMQPSDSAGICEDDSCAITPAQPSEHAK